MNFSVARPEYYEGLKVFQKHTDQQDRLKRLLGAFFSRLRTELGQETAPEDCRRLFQKPLVWKDIGCGDGSFTQKVFEALQENGFPFPDYEGFEIDEHFIRLFKEKFAGEPRVKIAKASGFDGILHAHGPCDVVSGFNALYFANDLELFRKDLEKTLNPSELGLFIQNKSFTEKAGAALIGPDYKDYTVAISTEVFFPAIPQRGFALVTGRASARDIENDSGLSEREKADTLVVKKIIDSMGGISTETEEGQKTAKKYEERILGDSYGGAGRYVSDNFLLVYTHPDAQPFLVKALKAAL